MSNRDKRQNPSNSTKSKRTSSDNNKYRILLVPFGKAAIETEIERGYKSFQRAIGKRSFEAVRVSPTISLICADDYHGLEHRPNGCGLYGDYFFIGVVEGDHRSLTDQELARSRAYLKQNRGKKPPTTSELDASVRVVSIPKTTNLLGQIARELANVPKPEEVDWQPSVHFTGTPDHAEQLGMILGLIKKHLGKIGAQFIYEPFPGRMFSIELMITDKAARNDCIDEYNSEMHRIFPELDQDED